ncbi:unnamed protein product [Lota lota]
MPLKTHFGSGWGHLVPMSSNQLPPPMPMTSNVDELAQAIESHRQREEAVAGGRWPTCPPLSNLDGETIPSGPSEDDRFLVLCNPLCSLPFCERYRQQLLEGDCRGETGSPQAGQDLEMLRVGQLFAPPLNIYPGRAGEPGVVCLDLQLVLQPVSKAQYGGGGALHGAEINRRPWGHLVSMSSVISCNSQRG